MNKGLVKQFGFYYRGLRLFGKKQWQAFWLALHLVRG
jgi:hypothetical protein